MVSKQVTIVSPTGLHARPASELVKTVKDFESAVTIKDASSDAAPVNAKSIMMILAAGLGTGTVVEIACDGSDEQAALDAILAIKDGDGNLFG